MEAVIEAVNIEKSYNGLKVLRHISIKLQKGEVIAIAGPNGCGKTTFLKILSGLENSDGGKLHVKGKISLIPQDNLLFPWFNVRKNISLGLKFRGVKKEIQESKVKEISEKLGITSYLKEYPLRLSGGTAKKVAIARALVLDPDILLLDEPFAGLDIESVATLKNSILMLKKSGISMIIVSHQLDELIEMADRIYFFSHRPATVKRTVDVGGLSLSEGKKLVSALLEGDGMWN